MRLRRAGALVALFLIVAGALAAAAPTAATPPAPVQWVTDPTGFLSPSVADALNGRLRSFENLTRDQVIVWIGTTIGNQDLEKWAADTFAAWGIGQKGKDNGLVLFILTQDRKIRIEVGYGLEGRVTDLLSFRIINDILKPGLAAGRQDEAVTRAVGALMTAVDPEAATSVGAPMPRRTASRAQPRKIGLGTIIFWGIIGVGFLFLLITNPTLAMFLLFSLMSGGRGGGGFGGGGGFSGGGGRSGGGGASGGW